MGYIFSQMLPDRKAVMQTIIKIIKSVPRQRSYSRDISGIQSDIASIKAKKDRLLDMSIEGVISTGEFKARNDGFNKRIEQLQGQLESLKVQQQADFISGEQLGKISSVLEDTLCFKNGIDPELVSVILEKIVVKKGSTKEQIQLDIYLRSGECWGVVFDRVNFSFCFTLPKNITHRAQTRTISYPLEPLDL